METKLNRLGGVGWGELKDIIIFGYGRYGRRVFPYLKRDFNVVAIVDNDVQKKGEDAEGIKVINFNDAEKILYSYKIIVTVQSFFYAEICKQLEGIGLQENIDFVVWSQFFPEWYYKYKNLICVDKTDIVVTSFCSLRCESCSAFIPYVKEKKHEKLEDIKRSVDSFFEKVDKVQDMNLYGGEPFLHPQLCEIIEVVGKYRDRIGYLGIITNGTIIPKSQEIEALKKYSIGVSVSDYSVSVDYHGKLDKLCVILEKNQINVTRTVNMTWFDLGFPRKKIQFDKDTVSRHMEFCNTACHDLINEKIYYCVADRAAQLGGLVSECKRSYIDLKKIDKGDMDSRKAILEFCAGNIEGGYLNFCKICGGFGSDNRDEILAARQMDICGNIEGIKSEK